MRRRHRTWLHPRRGGQAVRRRAHLLVGLLVIAGVTGCKPDITKQVLFVNDSVTNQSAIALIDAFNNVAAPGEPNYTGDHGRYAPNFGSSIVGIGLRVVPGVQPADVDAYWAAHLDSLMQHVAPEVMIVELGYNDCADLSTYGDSIDNFMAHVTSGTPVHWLTMADVKNQTTCDETVNAALTDATGRWSNLSLFDFGAFMAGHTEWVDDSGIHLTYAGKKAYAGWLHDQLDAVYLLGGS
jgi:hypothetical protein